MVQITRKPSLLHRSRMDIIADILNAANKGARKTHIMYKCNLSFTQLHVYLVFLKERKLLKSVPTDAEEKNGPVAYATTSRGRSFLQAYGSLRVLLSSMELED